MEKIYTIEDAKKKTQKSVNYYACRIEAWEKVTRNFKKDGGTFAILSKNFSNCDFRTEYGSPRIFVYFTNENGYRDSDYITLYANGEETTTPEGVQAQMNGLVEKYRKWLEVDTIGLESIEDQIKAIMPQLDTLKEAITEAKTTNTHYTMQSFIKNYLGILND